MICADILRCAHTFDWKQIFYVYINILGKRQYLMIFAVSSAQFIFAMSFACFCNKFCFDFPANICVYFQYLFMHVVCANIFGANVLIKIDVCSAQVGQNRVTPQLV